MPSSRARPAGRARSRARTSPEAPQVSHRATLAAGFCGIAVLGSVLTAGCAVTPSQAAPDIRVSSVQVTLPSASGVTDIYADVDNGGPADQIISATISVGGHIALRSPAERGGAQMHTVRSITIPARSFVGLDPNGSHLLVTDAGRMIAGREITLTLFFAHAGAISVPAMVTNPATGGASYFLN
jgi:copper(I)-binding protein